MRLPATLWILLAGLASAQPAREILEANCVSCHGAAKMGGLDLRSREMAIAGGQHGPAIAPGQPDRSLLLKAVLRTGDLKMPPGKAGLPAESIETIRKWIAEGAPFGGAPASKPREASWWAFRTPVRPAVPKTTGGASPANPVDAFLRAKLREKGLSPAPAASKLTLVRRAYFDLHGLPPDPRQVDRFLADSSPGAWEKLIDELLASPRYGERWGRHWLDVVRYADTGGFETDQHIRNAWRYRDYVIDSFNEDKPYDRFVQEQIAADEIWGVDMDLEGAYEMPKSKRESIQRWIGTTLYAIGPMAAEYTFYGDQYRAEWQADAVEVTASAFLGLTFGCARCHDHKFDPIPQRDYYRLAAIFSGSEEKEVDIAGRMAWIEYTRHLTRELHADEIKKKILQLQGRKKPVANNNGSGDANRKDEFETLVRQLGLAYLSAPKRPDTANVLVHTGKIHDTHVLVRGEWRQKGEKVEPGYPSFHADGPPVRDRERRKALAEWLTAKNHPLFARVMVNRIWQGHFGTGIVATPNDFGRQGDPPSHPELLDWLAVEFAEGGYRIKALHKQIMMSESYRMSSAPSAANAASDAENRYLWRMNRRRLEAEAVRDSVLAASGKLDTGKMGGPAVTVPISDEERNGMREASQWSVTLDSAEHDRRSVYLYVKRSFRLPMFETFDSPDAVASCARRESSTVATQALTLLNGDFVNRQAGHLAERLRRKHGGSPEQMIAAGYRIALGRPAAPEEIVRAAKFLETNRLERLCLMWFNLSEFLYVD